MILIFELPYVLNSNLPSIGEFKVLSKGKLQLMNTLNELLWIHSSNQQNVRYVKYIL